MSWESVLQVFMSGFAGIGAWFLYDLVREFKGFKNETKNDVFTLKHERNNFQTTIRNSEMTISSRVNEMQRISQEFSLTVRKDLQDIKFEISKIKESTDQASKNSKHYAEFLQRALELCKALDTRLKSQEQEVMSLHLKIKDLIIIKSGK